jgi:hypothetical protein
MQTTMLEEEEHYLLRGKSITSYRHPQLILVDKPASKQELTYSPACNNMKKSDSL